MHTSRTSDKVVFNHNGGYDGDILITAPDCDDENINHTVRVDFEDLKILVAEAIRSKHIEKIEQMSTDELLGIKGLE